MKTRTRGERGATMAEAGLIVPVVMFTVMALVGGALYLRSYFAIRTATESGAHAGSIATANAEGDTQILKAVKKNLSSVSPDALQTVVIFKMTDPEGPLPACVTGAPGPECNRYSSSDVANIDTSPGAPPGNQNWAPVSRVSGRSSPTYIGVYIFADAGTFSLFGKPAISNHSIARIEATSD